MNCVFSCMLQLVCGLTVRSCSLMTVSNNSSLNSMSLNMNIWFTHNSRTNLTWLLMTPSAICYSCHYWFTNLLLICTKASYLWFYVFVQPPHFFTSQSKYSVKFVSVCLLVSIVFIQHCYKPSHTEISFI